MTLTYVVMFRGNTVASFAGNAASLRANMFAADMNAKPLPHNETSATIGYTIERFESGRGY